MNMEYVKLRLEALREAGSRTRLAYIILTTASLAIMVAVWNSYLTWEDFAVYQDVWPTRGGKPFPVLAAAHADLIEQWIKTRWLTVAPLGIQIGSDDLAVWGSLGLAMIAIWFLFSMRLENQIVAWLLSDTMNEDKSLQKEVFVGVLSRLLFVRVSASDGPYDKLPAAMLVSQHSPDTSRFQSGFFFCHRRRYS
jgi:hypothetical protein